MLESVTDGGYVMLPFVVLVLFWLGALVTEFLGKPLCRHPLAYMLFPLGFLILGVLKISLCALALAESLKSAGGSSIDQISQDLWVHARALLAISVAAILTWLTAIIVMLIRGYTPGGKK